MDIRKEELEQIEYVLALKTTTKADVHLMETIIKHYIDKHIHICRHCPAQIRMAHKRLSNWYTKQSFNVIDDIEGEEIEAETLAQEEIFVDMDNEVMEEVLVELKPKKKGRPCSSCKEKKNGTVKG
jgi:hypothetical protein